MSDIVDRLRSHGVIPVSLGREAADEIEWRRLVADRNMQYTGQLQHLIEAFCRDDKLPHLELSHGRKLAAKHDEIERLRAGLSRCLLGDPPGDCYAAEVVELRAELARLAEAGTGYSQQTVDAITKERETLRAERDELRAFSLHVLRDAQRLHWLAADHADPVVRERVRSICQSIPTRSISGVRTDIDAAINEALNRGAGGEAP